MHTVCPVEGLKCGFFCFGRHQVKGEEFIGIEKCVSFLGQCRILIFSHFQLRRNFLWQNQLGLTVVHCFKPVARVASIRHFSHPKCIFDVFFLYYNYHTVYALQI
jgi:hypothetical protein